MPDITFYGYTRQQKRSNEKFNTVITVPSNMIYNHEVLPNQQYKITLEKIPKTNKLTRVYEENDNIRTYYYSTSIRVTEYENRLIEDIILMKTDTYTLKIPHKGKTINFLINLETDLYTSTLLYEIYTKYYDIFYEKIKNIKNDPAIHDSKTYIPHDFMEDIFIERIYVDIANAVITIKVGS